MAKQQKHKRVSSKGKTFFAGEGVPKPKKVTKKPLSKSDLQAAFAIAKRKGDIATAAIIGKRLMGFEPEEKKKEEKKKIILPKTEKELRLLKRLAEKQGDIKSFILISKELKRIEEKHFKEMEKEATAKRKAESLEKQREIKERERKKTEKAKERKKVTEKIIKEKRIAESLEKSKIKKLKTKERNLDNNFGYEDPSSIKDRLFFRENTDLAQKALEDTISDIRKKMNEVFDKIKSNPKSSFDIELTKKDFLMMFDSTDVREIELGFIRGESNSQLKQSVDKLKSNIKGFESGLKFLKNEYKGETKTEKEERERKERVEKRKLFAKQAEESREIRHRLQLEKQIKKFEERESKKKFVPPLQRRAESEFTTPPEVRKLNLQYKAGLKQLKKLKTELGEGYKTNPKYLNALEANRAINRQANKLKKEFQQKKKVGEFGAPKEKHKEVLKKAFKQASKEKKIIKKGLEKKAIVVEAKAAKKKQTTLDRTQIIKQISDLTASISLAKRSKNIAEESILTKRRIKLRQQAKELKQIVKKQPEQKKATAEDMQAFLNQRAAIRSKIRGVESKPIDILTPIKEERKKIAKEKKSGAFFVKASNPTIQASRKKENSTLFKNLDKIKEQQLNFSGSKRRILEKSLASKTRMDSSKKAEAMAAFDENQRKLHNKAIKLQKKIDKRMNAAPSFDEKMAVVKQKKETKAIEKRKERSTELPAEIRKKLLPVRKKLELEKERQAFIPKEIKSARRLIQGRKALNIEERTLKRELNQLDRLAEIAKEKGISKAAFEIQRDAIKIITKIKSTLKDVKKRNQ